jgi:YidC/Oxa1 family membrane protein insertase
MNISWIERMKQQEKGFDFENRYATITYRDTDDDTNELSNMGGDETKDEFDENIKWVSFKDQFFSQVLIAEKPLKASLMTSKQDKKGTGYLKTYTTELTADFDPSGKKATSFAMYLGPNDFSILNENEDLISSDSDLDLQSLVYLGWPIIRWVNRYFMIYFFDFLTSWGLNMGIVLLILTLVIKIAVFPLMRKAQVASAKMRVLRPKIDEISAKYPNPQDAMQKQQEVMQLYSEYGSNPMGGCLPMLIQMPIWIALFNFIPNAIELRGESFLWADDLSTYDDIINWGFDIWGIGDHLSIFCVLWCISTIATSWFSMRQQQDAMTPEQAQQMGIMKWMMYLMPLIFFFSFNGYSSGLNYYYFISSLISVIMTWIIRKSINDEKLLAQLEENRKKRKAQAAEGKRPSSMFTRMQELQQKQMEKLKEQQERQNRQNK